MKTTISLPNKLFHMAEEYADKHGLTRNEVYAAAVREFLKETKRGDRNAVTQKINEICDDTDTSLHPQIETASKRLLSNTQW